MLTAVRAMARRVAHDLAHMDTRRLGPDATPEEQDELLAEVLENALEAAQGGGRARARAAGGAARGRRGRRRRLRPDGDRGRGGGGAARRSEAPQLEHQEAPLRSLHLPQHESSSFRYCTNFAVTGERPRRRGRSCRAWRSSATRCWWWATRGTLRVHVHTDEPDRAVGLFEAPGRSRASTSPTWSEQIAEREARLGAVAGGLRRGRGCQRRGPPAPLPGARGARGRRRADDEPLHLRAARGHPLRARAPRCSCCRTAPT